MKNLDIQVFTHEVFGNVRIKEINGDPWFVAADVCRAFCVSNSRNVTDRLDADEKGVSVVDTLGGSQKMTIVNESGLYHMLFTMEPRQANGVSDEIINKRIEQLRDFKHWVTHDVLPSIRKHGGYLTKDKIEEALLNPDILIRLATDLKAEREARLAAESINQLNAPKVEFYDAVAESKDTIEMGEVAKILNVGIGRNRLFEILREHKVLMADNIPMQYYIDLKWFKCVESKYTKPDGGVFINVKTVVYQKGLDGIRKLLKEKHGLG